MWRRIIPEHLTYFSADQDAGGGQGEGSGDGPNGGGTAGTQARSFTQNDVNYHRAEERRSLQKKYGDKTPEEVQAALKELDDLKAKTASDEEKARDEAVKAAKKDAEQKYQPLLEARDSRIQDLLIENAILKGTKHHFNPKALQDVVQKVKTQEGFKFDPDKGEVIGLDEALDVVAKDFDYLLAQQAQDNQDPQTPPSRPPQGSPPAQSRSAGGSIQNDPFRSWQSSQPLPGIVQSQKRGN